METGPLSEENRAVLSEERGLNTVH
jgi:hypothetical protein